LKLEYDELLSTSAFNFNLRRYTKEGEAAGHVEEEEDDEEESSDEEEEEEAESEEESEDDESDGDGDGAGAYTRPLFSST